VQPNTLEWWEKTFEHDWVHTGINGIEQTRYFMQMLINNLPFTPSGTVLDYGCALGQGVNELSLAFPACRVEGYDYAVTAIIQARRLYPQHTFHSRRPAGTYNTVISSNVLEHYADPVAQMREHLEKAGRCYVAMTPYNERPNKTHPATITEHTLPVEISGFKRVHTAVIPPANKSLCYIAQIMFVYEKEGAHV
jgi:2-polyprenyl-3-methyl-5-hydroxy-6-metoxy-1,4-benzoquinol methylase